MGACMYCNLLSFFFLSTWKENYSSSICVQYDSNESYMAIGETLWKLSPVSSELFFFSCFFMLGKEKHLEGVFFMLGKEKHQGLLLQLCCCCWNTWGNCEFICLYFRLYFCSLYFILALWEHIKGMYRIQWQFLV